MTSPSPSPSHFIRLLLPSAHLLSLANNLASMANLEKDIVSAGDEAIDTLFIDSTFQSEDPDTQVQAEINSGSRRKAEEVVKGIGQQVASDLQVLKSAAELGLFEDLERILVPLDAQGREAAQQAGVVEDWLQVIEQLGALDHLVRWSRSQPADWLQWFLDHDHSVNLKIEGPQRAVLSALSDAAAKDHPEHRAHWTRWLLAKTGVVDSPFLKSIAVGGLLRSEPDLVAGELIAAGVEADPMKANWQVVAQRASGLCGATGKPFSGKQIQAFLETSLETIVERWPTLAQRVRRGSA